MWEPRMQSSFPHSTARTLALFDCSSSSVPAALTQFGCCPEPATQGSAENPQDTVRLSRSSAADIQQVELHPRPGHHSRLLSHLLGQLLPTAPVGHAYPEHL